MTSNPYTHSAQEGHGHWYWQRVSAIALAILIVWFACFVLSFSGDHGNYQAVVERLGNVWNSTMMILLIISIGVHASLGMQVVIEDYIHNTVWHHTAMIAQRLFCIMLSVMGIVAVIKIMAASSQMLLGGH
jgi:succinate dehydrogenase / fumarate reductase membrane anchor subunit